MAAASLHQKGCVKICLTKKISSSPTESTGPFTEMACIVQKLPQLSFSAFYFVVTPAATVLSLSPGPPTSSNRREKK